MIRFSIPWRSLAGLVVLATGLMVAVGNTAHGHGTSGREVASAHMAVAPFAPGGGDHLASAEEGSCDERAGGHCALAAAKSGDTSWPGQEAWPAPERNGRDLATLRSRARSPQAAFEPEVPPPRS